MPVIGRTGSQVPVARQLPELVDFERSGRMAADYHLSIQKELKLVQIIAKVKMEAGCPLPVGN